jgi:plastocyanin
VRQKYIAFGVVFLMLIVTMVGCGSSDREPVPAATPKPVPTVAPVEEVSSSGQADFSVALLGVGGTGYAFDPETLTLQSGQSYSIELESGKEFHTWTVVDADGSYIQNVQVLAGENQTVQITAPAPGTYKLICLPHQAMGMEGKIVVN